MTATSLLSVPQAHNHLVADLDTMGFQVEETQSFANDVTTAMLKLKEKDVRIILGNFNESWARRIFCEAHRVGMFGRKYQWLIMGTYTEEWWLSEEGLVPCSVAEVITALEGCILTDLLPLSTNGEITVSGITAEEYLLEYDSRRGAEYSRFHGYTYDGVWAVALAIQHVARRIRHYRKNQTVVDFRYRDPLWETLFLEALRNTSFEGVTGPVRFYDNERKASILLKQFQNGSEVKVGEFNGVSEQLDLTRGHPIKWNGRYPPKDRTLHVYEHSHVNVTIYSVLATAASLGIIVATLFLAINITYRNQRYIKMSSPYLNNLIIIGCMLTYSSVIFLGLDSTLTSVDSFPYICTARAWLLMAGFSLAFGSMFSKTWRVHSIFTDVKLNKKVIKDYQLFMVVGILLVIDLAIMTTWQAADPFYRETKQMEPYPHPSSDDIVIIPENEYCTSELMTIFVGSIYAYKGLLMIFGAFLAWETRNVNIPALNDSKYVGMSVYNVVIMCIMGAAISFVLSDKQDASFIIISIFIIFCTTGTLCLVFVPKLIELKRNPQGSIDKRCRATLRPMSKTRRDSSVTELEERMKDAKVFNQKYRKQLLEKESELQALMRRLGEEDRGTGAADGGMDRLVVPKQDGLSKKEAPSGTETTDISSLCSLTSSQDGEYVNLTVETPGQRRKKTTFAKQPMVAMATTMQFMASTAVRPETEAPRDVTVEQPRPSEPPHHPPEYEESEERPMLPEEKSLIAELMEDRPRMATPPHQQPPLAKVVSFGDVTGGGGGGGGGGVAETILPPPKQFKHRPTPLVSYPAAAPCKQHGPAASALRRRASVKTGGTPGVVGGPAMARRTSVPATSYAVAEHACLADVYGGGGAAHHRQQRAQQQARGGGPAYLLNGGGDLLVSPTNLSSPNVAAMVKSRDLEHEETISSIIQRSVSEKSRERSATGCGGRHYHHLHHLHQHHHHHPQLQGGAYPLPHYCDTHGGGGGGGTLSRAAAAEAARQRDRDTLDRAQFPALRHQKSAIAHVQSTPNVASLRGGFGGGRRGHFGSGERNTSSGSIPQVAAPAGMCSAVSEGELLDLAILPIFQKLLSERHKSRSGYGASIASCPNISIKCDIVEYL